MQKIIGLERGQHGIFNVTGAFVEGGEEVTVQMSLNHAMYEIAEAWHRGDPGAVDLCEFSDEFDDEFNSEPSITDHLRFFEIQGKIEEMKKYAPRPFHDKPELEAEREAFIKEMFPFIEPLKQALDALAAEFWNWGNTSDGEYEEIRLAILRFADENNLFYMTSSGFLAAVKTALERRKQLQAVAAS